MLKHSIDDDYNNAINDNSNKIIIMKMIIIVMIVIITLIITITIIKDKKTKKNT